jgi:hypothetical protein
MGKFTEIGMCSSVSPNYKIVKYVINLNMEHSVLFLEEVVVISSLQIQD